MDGSDPPPAFVGVAPVSIYPCGKAPWPARGPDDDDQDEAHKPAGCRPVLASNRAELSPSARGEREPFGLNCDRAGAGRAGHPKGRSAAEDGVAVYAPGLRRLSGLFLGVRSDFQQQGRSLYLYLELLVYYLYVVRVFGRRFTPPGDGVWSKIHLSW